MMRTPRPWYRKQTDTWYVCRHGQQIPLAKGKDNKAEANQAYFQLMVREGDRLPEARLFTVAQVADLFLDWCKQNNEPCTYRWYKDFLQDFCDRHGSLPAPQVKKYHITQWLGRHPGWGPTSQWSAITAVKRAFNFAVDEGILTASPLKHVVKPKPKSRNRVLTDVERQQILAAIRDQKFKDFVVALQETGCRPSEVARLAPENIDLLQGLWTFDKHKTVKKTGRPRLVYLTPAMIELTKKLLADNMEGPLFRNCLGKPWTPNAIRCRFRHLRKKLPGLKNVSSYTYRHTYVTDALENGVGVVEVAELIGDKGTEMVMKHYQHLSEKREYMRKAAIKATQRATEP